MAVDADLHDLRDVEPAPALDPESYAASQALAAISRARNPTGLSTRASGILVGSASHSSTRTARQTPCRDGTSIITGMAQR
jgi:hypothetical protein